MTISSTSRTAGPFTGNGVTAVFPFSYKVFARSDVLVAQTVTASGVETIKVLDSDFTVALNTNQNTSPGGVITMAIAPPVGTTLAATSNLPIQQSLNLTNNGGFYPTVINDALDRIVINVQQIAARVGAGALNVGAAAKIDAVINALASLGSGAGAGQVGYPATTTVAAALDAPFVITGVANIRNPAYGAPIANAEDPGAAAANAAASQRMFNSGAKRVEFDHKRRRINNTLLAQSSLRIDGSGRTDGTGLVWTGGDAPAIAQANYASPNAAGFPNIRIHNLLLEDLAATRANHWTVDLTNSDSCGIQDSWIGITTVGTASHKFGIALGLKQGSTYNQPCFVAFIKDSRISGGKVMMNTSDWYIDGSELWGNNRDHALEISAGGSIVGGTQIVPGNAAGIWLFNDSGFNIDTLKIADTFFDGSYDNIVTGTGIKSAPGIGLITAEINGCNFWHLNGSGMDIASMVACNIDSVFNDCDSKGVGVADIISGPMQSSRIVSRHFRNAVAPKTGAARGALGAVMQLTGLTGFPLNEVNALVTYDSTYTPAVFTNPSAFKTPSGSAMAKIVYATLPDPAQFKGEIINAAGLPRFSNGTAWYILSLS